MGDRKAVEKAFGFLLAHYVEEYRDWNTTDDQEAEILKRIRAWMDENNAYMMTSRSDKVPVPLAEEGPDPDSQPSTDSTENVISRTPDEPDSSITLSGYCSEASGC